MSAAPKLKLTPQEYLERERLAEFKSEYFNGETFAMAGPRAPHVRINGNFTGALVIAFGDGPCYPLPGDLKVKVDATGLYTYPDMIVMCEEMQLEDDHSDVLLNPKIIVEILSPSTERYDRGRKFKHFQQIASLQEYILVDQDAPHIDRFHRRDAGTWELKSFDGLASEFAFASIPAAVPMAKIYRGITFPSSEAETLRLPYS